MEPTVAPYQTVVPSQYFVPVSSITEEQKARLLDNDVKLTDKGKRAYEIIISVIADIIGQK